MPVPASRGVPCQAVIATPFGRLGVRVEDGAVSGIFFLPDDAGLLAPADPLAGRVAAQVERYLCDPAFRFDLPLKPAGTEFQRRVWNAISAIPPGGTRSYGEIARDLGSASRAVGQACGENRFPLVIPCHRVVSARGIGGFAHAHGGYLLRVKRWLLAHEAGGVGR